MKQLTKAIAVVLCIALFTACSGSTADERQSKSDSIGSLAAQPADAVQGPKPASPDKATLLQAAKKDNPDTAAWLYIPGTDIDSPVMQTANNEDYLRKDENGKYDIWGSYFADYYSVLADRDSLKQNTVIYGHSESSEDPDGKRFTQLFKYLNLDFVQTNPNIYLTLGEDELTFEVFAVFFTDIDFYYIDPTPSDQGFDAFKKTVAEKNEYIFDSGVSEQDKLLTLSTCAYRYDTENAGNQRLVVMAKLLPEGAAGDVGVLRNTNPERP